MKKCSVQQALELLSNESDLFSFQQPIFNKETAGIKYSKELIQNHKNVIDKSDSYKGYIDLNEKLISIQTKIKAEGDLQLER